VIDNLSSLISNEFHAECDYETQIRSLIYVSLLDTNSSNYQLKLNFQLCQPKKLNRNGLQVDYNGFIKSLTKESPNIENLHEKLLNSDIIIYVVQRKPDIERLLMLRKGDLGALKIPVEEHQEHFYELFLNENLNKKVFVMSFQNASIVSLDKTDMLYFFPSHYKPLVNNIKIGTKKS
jgi:hypothetical protein